MAKGNLVVKPLGAIAGRSAQSLESVREKTIATAVDSALAKVGDLIKQSFKEEEIEPEWVGKAVSEAREAIWADVTRVVKDAVLVGSDDKRFGDSLMRFRSARAPPFVLSPSGALAWLQPKLLYTLVPSDSTMWEVLNDASCLSLRLLMLVPGINSLLFGLFFLMLYKRDEFQLISFISMSRSYQCVTNGLGSLITAGYLYHSCLSELDRSEEAPVANLHLLCAHSTPSDFPQAHLAQAHLALEPLRVLAVWLAHILLFSGYARGGKAALKVYEDVRNDAADGTLDGQVDSERAAAISARVQLSRLRSSSELTEMPQQQEAQEARPKGVAGEERGDGAAGTVGGPSGRGSEVQEVELSPRPMDEEEACPQVCRGA